jgi:hypothetical protein
MEFAACIVCHGRVAHFTRTELTDAGEDFQIAGCFRRLFVEFAVTIE